MAKFNDIKDEFLQYIRDGATFKEACQAVGVSLSQAYEWKATKAEFAEELKKANKIFRETMLRPVENALLKRALGFSYEEVKTETFPDGTERITKTTKQVAPDTGAAIFILCNVSDGDWRNKVEQKVEGDLRTTVNVAVESKSVKDEIDKLGK